MKCARDTRLRLIIIPAGNISMAKFLICLCAAVAGQTRDRNQYTGWHGALYLWGCPPGLGPTCAHMRLRS